MPLTLRCEIRVASTERELLGALETWMAAASAGSHYENVCVTAAPMAVGDVALYLSVRADPVNRVRAKKPARPSEADLDAARRLTMRGGPFRLTPAPPDEGEEEEEEEEEPALPVFLVERKSRADLEASKRDGRYVEQAIRLTNCGQVYTPRQVIYWIEGGTDARTLSLEQRVSLFRTQVSLVSKPGHDFLVFRSQDVADTALGLLALATRVRDMVDEDVCARVARAARQRRASAVGDEEDPPTDPENELASLEAVPYFLLRRARGDGRGDAFAAQSEQTVQRRLQACAVVSAKRSANTSQYGWVQSALGLIPCVGADIAALVAAACASALASGGEAARPWLLFQERLWASALRGGAPAELSPSERACLLAALAGLRFRSSGACVGAARAAKILAFFQPVAQTTTHTGWET